MLSVTLINADTKLPWMAYLSEYTKKDACKDIPWNPAAITRSDVLYGYEQDDRLVDVDYFTADIDATYAHAIPVCATIWKSPCRRRRRCPGAE